MGTDRLTADSERFRDPAERDPVTEQQPYGLAPYRAIPIYRMHGHCLYLCGIRSIPRLISIWRTCSISPDA